MARALVFGGTGQIGRTVSYVLLDAGWRVDVVARGGRSLETALLKAGAHRLNGEGRRRRDLIAGATEPYDAVFDANCFTAGDAADLLARRDRVGAYCVVSSASVYRDDRGRSLDEARETGFPDFQGPVAESNPTVVPGDTTYSTLKVAMEQALLSSGAPVTVLRPGAIYGIKARHPREWWFVKRALDGRRRVPLSFEGQSLFHTSSAAGIASLVRLCLERGETGVFNVADPRPRSVAEISVAVGQAIGHAFELMPFPGPAQPPAFVGRTPWSAARPIVLDTKRAKSIGWDGGPDYSDAVAPYCQWLIETARDGDWRKHFSVFGNYSFDPFDYDAEDAVLGPGGSQVRDN